jgi:hypothetical protein
MQWSVAKWNLYPICGAGRLWPGRFFQTGDSFVQPIAGDIGRFAPLSELFRRDIAAFCLQVRDPIQWADCRFRRIPSQRAARQARRGSTSRSAAIHEAAGC